jgi:hypothetical protein
MIHQSVRWSHPSDGLLRVGISGHRDLPVEDHLQIRSEVRTALTMLAREFAEAASSADPAGCCRLVSGLAAGADQLVAEEALALGWTLEALLPMLAEDYLTDFVDPTERAGFERLMASSVRVAVIDRPLQLDEDVEDFRNQCYRDQGSHLVAAVQAMILLWDGRPAKRGACGTSWVAHLCREEAQALSGQIVVIPVRRANG